MKPLIILNDPPLCVRSADTTLFESPRKFLKRTGDRGHNVPDGKCRYRGEEWPEDCRKLKQHRTYADWLLAAKAQLLLRDSG